MVTPAFHTIPCPGNLAIKRLTPVEIQRKREKDECWFCTDKWTNGHKCGLKQLLMLDVLDSEEVVVKACEVPPELHNMELSACAFYGTNGGQTSKTMKIEGQLNG
ncbi:hypothetical protein ACFX15_037115 [Malus domestica]